MKVKEESEKVGLKLNSQKTKIMASGPITPWEIDGETVETVSEFTFLGSKITAEHEWTGWISLQSKGLSRVFSNTTTLQCSAFFIVQLSHSYTTTGKTTALTRWTFVGKVMSLLLNMLSRLVITLQASFNFMAAVTICSDLGAQKNKVSHCFHCFSICLP